LVLNGLQFILGHFSKIVATIFIFLHHFWFILRHFSKI